MGQDAATRGGGRGATTTVATVGRYQILEKIGEGGMGALFLARDPAIERLVAIKVLRRGYDSPDLRERFLREGRAAGRLRHPHIVTIFDVGESDGDPFIAMEFLAGETMAELIRQGARLTVSRRLRLLEELCDGLGYAHRAGLVHRDIKPANLMIDADGSLKILDFGIVRLGESGMTEAGSLVGTVNYMSPEQVAGEPVDHRSDIFAVGLVAYEFLSSRQAFPGAIGEGLFHRILNVNYEPLMVQCPTLDLAVVAIVAQALQRDPALRFQDLARMRKELAVVRERLEDEEERAASEASAGAGETAVVSTPVPSSIRAGGTVRLTPSPGPPTPAALADAEHALATGNYRVALRLAGRSAIEGVGRNEASSIVQRANSALLEQGRRLEKTPPPASTTDGAPPPAKTHGATWIAAAVAVVAVAAAVWALLLRPGLSPAAPPATSTTSTAAPPPIQSRPLETPPAPAPAATSPEPPAPPPGTAAPVVPPRDDRTRPSPRPSSTDPAASPARGPAPSRPPADPPAGPTIVPVRVGTGGVEAPRRIRQAEPVYPPAALAAGIQGSVELELTIGADGSVGEARVMQSVAGLDEAAQQAVMKWQYAPTIVGGVAVPVIHTVRVPFTLPAAEAPARPRETVPPPAPAPATPDPAPPKAPEPRVPPPPDPRAEEAAIRQQLRSYEEAWRSLSLPALRQVQQLSPTDAGNVQRTMESAQTYEVTIAVDGLKIDGARAQVHAQVSRRFQPRSGRGSNTSVAQTIDLEKQGDRWVILRFR